MIAFDDISQQEQGKVVSPLHVFPVTAIGRVAETQEVLLSVRIYASKKNQTG